MNEDVDQITRAIIYTLAIAIVVGLVVLVVATIVTELD